MTYVMGDIHGEFERYKEMLSKINLSMSDSLYLMGDIIDRKPNGVDIALDAMSRENVFMLKGNHEVMCLDTLGQHPAFGAKNLWYYNGGYCTFMDLTRMRSCDVRDNVLQYFEDAPLYRDIEVSGQKYHLVHGCPSPDYDKMVMIWDRPTEDTVSPFPDTTVIVGHTPTPFIDCALEFPSVRIWYGDGIIDVDCGCGHDRPTRRLACLRLDDMTEFYV